MGPFPTKIFNLNNVPTYVVQAYRFGQFMGKVDLEFDLDDQLVRIAGEPILLDQSIEQHGPTHDTVMEWRSSFDKLTKNVVGVASGDYPFLTCKFGTFI